MKLNVSFEESQDINVKFSQFECVFQPDFGEIVTIRSNNTYQGEYNVIPRVYRQNLETRDKLMLDDVTVEVIPMAKVINWANGYTVTIG